jgi:hypothetical protein
MTNTNTNRNQANKENKMNNSTEALREIMTAYDSSLAKWVRVNGTDKGFNEWFTNQVIGVEKNMTNELITIAKCHLTQGATLDTRNSDSLDFHDCHVCCIQAALEAAYAAGYASAQN